MLVELELQGGSFSRIPFNWDPSVCDDSGLITSSLSLLMTEKATRGVQISHTA